MSKALTDRELYSRYDDFLDECYGLVKLAGYKYYTSNALKQVDSVAYDTGFNDWLDAECQDERLFEHNEEYFEESQDETDLD
jgi:hypothetical protein